MPDIEVDWSPADDPYAIAVSEAQWWLRCAELARRRMHDGDDPRSPGFSSRQIDARQLVVALHQMLVAENLQQKAIRALDVGSAVYAELGRARQRFETAAPNIKNMRDALIHFDEWSRGTGGGPQRKDIQRDGAAREVAAKYWGFSYDPEADTVTLGRWEIHVATAVRAASELATEIYRAARAVDLQATSALRVRIVSAMRAAGLTSESANAPVKLSQGMDSRIWVSLNGSVEHGRREISEQIVAVVTAADLRLLAPADPLSDNHSERLRTGEALQVIPKPTRR